MDMSESLKYQLWAGRDVYIPNVGNLRPLKVGEIIDLGYENYQYYLSLLLIEEEDINIKSIGSKNTKPTIDIIIKLCLEDKHVKQSILGGLNLFFNTQFEFVYDEELLELFNTSDVFRDMNNFNNVIAKEDYENIKFLLRKQYCLPEREKLVFGNERARKMHLTILENKKKYPQPKPTISLLSIMDLVIWEVMGGDYNKVMNMTIYQINSAYYRLSHTNNYKNTMLGIYTGNIDTKSVEMKKIDWAKILEV